MVQSGIEPATYRIIAQFYRNLLFVNKLTFGQFNSLHRFTVYVYRGAALIRVLLKLCGPLEVCSWPALHEV